MPIVIDAIKMCEELKNKQRHLVDFLKLRGETPKLAIINASDDAGNARYIKNKIAECEAVGIEVILHKLDASCVELDIINILLDCDIKRVPVILQLPTFKHINPEDLMSFITSDIDADGFSTHWIGKLSQGIKGYSEPATPKGVMNLLRYHNVDIKGKVALVIGRSSHVGKPLSTMLINEGATVISANSHTKDLRELVRIADIVIPCVGRPNLINPEDVKEGAVLIGVGFTYIDGKQILDFDVDEMVSRSRASLVTNRINCTGKATVNALIDNTLGLYLKQDISSEPYHK